MRLDRRSTDSNGITFLTLIPTEDEDLWHLRNLICENNTLRSRTTRKVVKEGSGSGSTAVAEKVVVTLILKVVKLEYDPMTPSLRISGKNISENEHVPLGAHHTVEVQMNAPVSIGKGYLTEVDEEIIREATDETRHGDLAVLAMQEGLANLCLLTPTRTVLLQRVEHPIPKKRRGGVSGSHDKAMEAFFKSCAETLRRALRWDIVKAVLIGSPGVLKSDFFEYLMTAAQQNDLKEVMAAKSKFMTVKLSSGHVHAIKELFENPDVTRKVSELKNAREVVALETFYQRMNEDPDCVTYGPKHVARAVEDDVVEVLMVSDSLLYFQNAQRSHYCRLMKRVEEMGGVALRFSSLHFTGAELNRMTGVAAILRYSYPCLDEVEEELVPCST